MILYHTFLEGRNFLKRKGDTQILQQAHQVFYLDWRHEQHNREYIE